MNGSALSALSALVAPLQAEVRARQAGTVTVSSRQAGVFDAGDYTMAAQVLAAARPLTPWRRALVKRRCARIFGAHAIELAAASPPADDSMGAVAAPLFVSLVRSRREVTEERKFGLLHRALLTDGASPELARLAVELDRLAAAR